ncbi:hypothetical protein [Ralstonia solanacearum]|uniref:hypothetical protein n=1 Tax=Ralstonia solanacearum TaxID=305 RepID=UPI0013C4B325|nr:hypothetical protein [Ralstonia solanacearum]
MPASFRSLSRTDHPICPIGQHHPTTGQSFCRNAGFFLRLFYCADWILFFCNSGTEFWVIGHSVPKKLSGIRFDDLSEWARPRQLLSHDCQNFVLCSMRVLDRAMPQARALEIPFFVFHQKSVSH